LRSKRRSSVPPPCQSRVNTSEGVARVGGVLLCRPNLTRNPCGIRLAVNAERAIPSTQPGGTFVSGNRVYYLGCDPLSSSGVRKVAPDQGIEPASRGLLLCDVHFAVGKQNATREETFAARSRMSAGSVVQSTTMHCMSRSASGINAELASESIAWVTQKCGVRFFGPCEGCKFR